MNANPSKRTVILVGLIGCFLTSVAGITGSMLLTGWEVSGGTTEWLRRFELGYPCSCLVVLVIFPYLVQRLNRFLERT